jgi:hypothetical protein
MLPLAGLRPDPTQVRHSDPRTGRPEALEASVHKQGVLLPLLVRPRGADEFAVVAGEPRFRIAAAAGVEQRRLNVSPPCRQEARVRRAQAVWYRISTRKSGLPERKGGNAEMRLKALLVALILFAALGAGALKSQANPYYTVLSVVTSTDGPISSYVGDEGHLYWSLDDSSNHNHWFD